MKTRRKGGYTAQALGHAIFTEGESLDELRDNVRDAVRFHFEEGIGPQLIRLHFIGDEVLAWVRQRSGERRINVTLDEL